MNLDVDRFMKDIESMLGSQEQGDDESDGSEGSSMDMDFEDDSEGEDPNDDEKEAFMETYSGAMNEELKNSTLEKSFEHVNQHSSKQNGVILA